MTITRIQQTKRGRYSVTVDGEFWCALHGDTYYQSGLREGQEVTPRQLEEIRLQSDTRLAVEKAARILSHAANTSRQLYDKLRRSVDERAAAAAVERMLELGYLDDEDYARRLAADLVHLKGYGPRRVAETLRQKGLTQEQIQQAVDSLGEEDSEERLCRLLERKYARYLGDEKGLRRTVNSLLRMGYSYGEIRQAINRYTQWEGEEDPSL